MKRSVAILLSVLLLMSSVPMVSADIYNDDQFDWGDDACPHTQTETVEAAASTCTTPGHGAYTYCVACKLLLDGSRDPLPLGDHTYEVATTPADCTNEGLNVYTCSACGHSYEEVIPTNGKHVYVYTCDQYCNSCGEKTNPRAKHTVLHVEAKEAVSCIEFGNVEYWYCSSCNTVWLDADLRRQSNMKSVQTAGQCQSDSPACKDGVCIHCGLPCAAEAEHTYDGACDASCNVCGDIREVEGHAYNAVVTAPDCEKGGYTTYTCANCGDTYTADETEALGHTYVPLSAEPATCDKDGFEKYYCQTCGDSYTDTIPAIGHDYTVATTPADCTNDGLNVYTCSVCGHSYEEVIPANGKHVYVYTCDQYCNSCGEKTNPRAKHTVLHVEAKEAVSCIEFGNVEYWYCSSCNTVWLDADLRRQSNMKSVQTAGQCQSDSLACKDGLCIHCGLPCAAEAEHTYDNACDVDCNVCGDIREVEGHAYHADVTAPDCEKGGYTTYTCANCGDTYTADETEALGHSYDSDSDPDCNVCGAVRVVALPGDADGNGKVNNRDLGILQKHLNGSAVTLDESAVDLDGNGKINNRDLGLLQKLLNA